MTHDDEKALVLAHANLDHEVVELGDKEVVLGNGRTAHRVIVYVHCGEDEDGNEYCAGGCNIDHHYYEDDVESHWAVVLESGEVEANSDLEDLEANIDYKLQRAVTA